MCGSIPAQRVLGPEGSFFLLPPNTLAIGLNNVYYSYVLII